MKTSRIRLRTPALAILLAGGYILFGIAENPRWISDLVPSPSVSLDRQELGEQPLLSVTVYYPAELIRMVEISRGEGADVFSDFETMSTAWRAIAGDRPLTLQFVCPRRADPLTGGEYLGAHPRETIDRSNFGDMVVFLKEIGDLVLQADGSGSGVLSHTEYRAEATRSGDGLSLVHHW
jgi:hypothetical protein